MTELLQINASIGHAAAGGDLAENYASQTLRNKPPEVRPFLSPPVVDGRDWRNPAVGWGVILLDGQGPPEPIQQLVRERGDAPVFRYLSSSEYRLRYLRDPKNACDVSVASSPQGIGIGKLPRYLLIYGGPEQIPWDLQYALNATRAVGRIHLTGDALERYVAALLSDWGDAQSTTRTVVWCTDHGGSDITSLIRRAFVDPLVAQYQGDADITQPIVNVAANATTGALQASFKNGRTAVVVTASHGQTFPLNDREAMIAMLGAPVDQSFNGIEPSSIVENGADVYGAVWYAHACCSAGSDERTMFAPFVNSDSEIAQVLRGVAALGARVAPLPDALLSAKRPVKAFIGHIEPTFNWTLEDPLNSQQFGDPLVKALYNELFAKPVNGFKTPVGHAFRQYYSTLAGLYTTYDRNRNGFNAGKDTIPDLFRNLLVARDVQSSVILGDPTVTL